MRKLLIFESFSNLDIEVLDFIIGKTSSQLETIINGIELAFEVSDNGIFFLSDDDENEASENNIVLDKDLETFLIHKCNSMKHDSRMKSLGFFKKITT